jgi:hypothetical protein
MKRLLALALSAALSMSAVSCSDSTGPAGGLVGTYNLQTINGQPLPVTIASDVSTATDVLGERIVIDASGSYSDVITFRDRYSNGAPSSTYQDNINGYWTLSGNQVTFTPSDPTYDVSYATVSGNTMTANAFDFDGTPFTLVYTR